MAKIKKLAAEVSNQIAAGEVVERPASVVKELVENALDAGADKIIVEFTGGGIDSIKISDNGQGIAAEELAVAVKKHTTSKIESATDLARVKTLGFRGEALASIASVSEMEISSRTDNSAEGALLTKSPGEPPSVKPAGRRRGTTVTVQQLFATIPARRKFLASQTTEKKHIIETVQKKILAHPEVHFILREGDKVILNVPSGGLRERVASTLGGEIIRQLIPLEKIDADYRGSGRFTLTGLISNGEAVHYSRRNQFLFVNGRPVRDPIFYRAVTQAYRELVLTDRHPVVILFFNLPGTEVDVNVHPRKEEVRFNNSNAIYKFVNEAISNTLQEHYQDDLQGAVSEEEIARSGVGIDRFKAENRFIGPMVAGAGSQDDLFDFTEAESTIKNRIVGQFKRLFLLVEQDSGLLFVDQHNAHEKILYERYMEKARSDEAAQYLSVPLKIELSSADRESLLDNQPQLAKLGLEIEPFGGSSMVIQSVPGFLGRRTADKKLIFEIIEEFIEAEKEDRVMEPKKQMLAIMSCRNAVKRGELLMPREQEEIVAGLTKLKFPKLCPHGRPVYYELKNQEMAKWVGRSLSDLEPR